MQSDSSNTDEVEDDRGAFRASQERRGFSDSYRHAYIRDNLGSDVCTPTAEAVILEGGFVISLTRLTRSVILLLFTSEATKTTRIPHRVIDGSRAQLSRRRFFSRLGGVCGHFQSFGACYELDRYRNGVR